MLYAGVDEVAVSCIAGPLVVSVVILPEDHEILELPIDSKRLNDDKIKELANKIKEKAIFYRVFDMPADKVDEFGIDYALVKLLNKCAKKLFNNGYKLKVVVDGKKKIPSLKNSTSHEAIIGADATHDNVSAAAILAKDYSNDIMIELDSIYPGYNFNKNKGYITAEHIEAIKKLEFCPAHRLSSAKEALIDKNNLNSIIESTNIPKNTLKSSILALSALYDTDETLFSEFQARFYKYNYRKVMNEDALSPKSQYWISRILLDVFEKYNNKNHIGIKREFLRSFNYINDDILDLINSILNKAS